MKGLLLKDFYMVKKYCKTHLLITVVFLGLSLTNNGNLFFAFYPCLLAGMIPATLLAYDERSRWMEYSQTLPYTQTQMVSAKYLMGLFVQTTVLILSGTVQAIDMSVNGTFDLRTYLTLLAILLALSTATSSISLPFMFRFGVEKGRIAYYVTIGMVCAGSVLASSLFETNKQAQTSLDIGLPILCAAGIGIYALSWYLSVVFYKKREIN